MKQPFHTDDSVLVDYLDHTLDDREQAVFEEHMAHCSKCREKIAAQRAWTAQLKRSNIQDDPDKYASSSSLDRMRQALLSDIRATKQQDPGKLDPGSEKHHISWMRLSGIAAALLVVAVLVPLLAHQWSKPATGERAVVDVEDYAQSIDNQTTPADQPSDDGLAPADQGGWRIYNGSLADLSAMQMFFEPSDSSAETETTAKSESDEMNNESTAGGETTIDLFINQASSLNADGQSLVQALQQAKSVQVAVRQNETQQIMILASYPIDEAKNIKNDLDRQLSKTKAAVQVAIVRYAELEVKLDAYEDGLADRLLADSKDARMAWILLVIGA